MMHQLMTLAFLLNVNNEFPNVKSCPSLAVSHIDLGEQKSCKFMGTAHLGKQCPRKLGEPPTGTHTPLALTDTATPRGASAVVRPCDHG